MHGPQISSCFYDSSIQMLPAVSTIAVIKAIFTFINSADAYPKILNRIVIEPTTLWLVAQGFS